MIRVPEFDALAGVGLSQNPCHACNAAACCSGDIMSNSCWLDTAGLGGTFQRRLLISDILSPYAVANIGYFPNRPELLPWRNVLIKLSLACSGSPSLCA